MVFELYEFLTRMEVGLPIMIALFTTVALVYVYRDAKLERIDRQNVMDRQNEQWLGLYKENLEETAKTREEMSKTREVISELKGVIQALYNMGIKRAS